MRICGVDPGLQTTGYGVVEAAGRDLRVLDAGTICAERQGELSERLQQIHTDLSGLLRETRPDLLAVENLYSHYKHPQTAVLMGHVRGVILQAAAAGGIPVTECPSTRIKRLLTGNGRASKAQMQQAVRLRLGLDEPPEPHDVADALALAVGAAVGLRDAAWAGGRGRAMIVKLRGVVAEVETHTITVERDDLAHEVLIPGYALGEMAACRGRPVTLYTLEFLEGSATGGNFVPRMVGFPRAEDRAFFNRFVAVKGFGPRKALKALSEPIGKIAGWISSADTRALTRLPGIGARAAQMIVAELRGKVDEFAGELAAPEVVMEWTAAQRDALEVMVAWGDPRADAERWMARSSQLHPDLENAEAWVRACYRIKTGSER